MPKATWVKHGKRVTGEYCYYWPSDIFIITLNTVDPITGDRLVIRTHDDDVGFNLFTSLLDISLTIT
jgi:hypothetical protein